MQHFAFHVLLGQSADVVPCYHFIGIQKPRHNLGWEGCLVVISCNCLLKALASPSLPPA